MKTLLAVALGTSLLVPGAAAAEPPAPVSDLHNSVLHRLFTAGGDPAAGLADSRFAVNLAGLESAHAQFLFLSIGIPRFSLRGPDETTLDDVVVFLEKFKRSQSAPGGQLAFAGDRAQLGEVLAGGRTAYAFALEGSHLLEGDVAGVDRLHAAGVRMIGIAHWFQNDFFTDPAEPVRANREPRRLDDRMVLSEQGRALVGRLIEKGILIDVSHLRRAAFDEVVALNAGRTPLVASHSNARAVCDVPRNLDDSQIRAIAESGGLIGVCLHQPLLVAGERRAGVADVVDHIDHLRQVAGAAHVAIGSDFEGGITTPSGLGRFADLGKLGEEMAKRGYPPADRDAILWKNAQRLLPPG